MDWLRNIGWLVLSVMWLNFYSLNQFGRNCYFKITDLNLSNNGINAVNLSNILNHKEIISHVPEFFSESTVPIVYYTYIIQLHLRFWITKSHSRTLTLRNSYKTSLNVIVLCLLSTMTHCDMSLRATLM